MYRPGQITKTVLGFPVEIIAVLDTPDDYGYSVVGVLTVDGEREISTWRANGIGSCSGKRSCLDLEAAR